MKGEQRGELSVWGRGKEERDDEQPPYELAGQNAYPNE
jgi:hypothetical protein